MRMALYISKAKPDLYDGVDQQMICPEVKEELSEKIIPTKGRDPAAPNFFVEVTSKRQDGEIGQRQVGHDGALGARGMHSLQNYEQQTQVYDGNAYTFGVTYHRFQLTIYAIYMTAPSEEGGKPRYDVHEIATYSMRDSDRFPEGIIACRNIRDLAKEYRVKFVEEANERAKQSSTHAPSVSGDATDMPEHDAEEPTDPGVDAESQAHLGGGQDNRSEHEHQAPRVGAIEPTTNLARSLSQVTMSTVEVGGHHLRGRRRRREETPEEQEPPPRKRRRARGGRHD
ncbi:hypothetical protein VMCG_09174 [Cytospora schulzeri]|uniref:DUF7924 domain-containing protein n=1 Tax=Cytospora schulzeri TaxID=448051 RepID=A0A423VLH7_9PEZI|nr:hypothetical protein VMCG_09174 [Valsa malicola]